MKRILIISQTLGQNYYSVIQKACGVNVHLTVISGSEVNCDNIIYSPAYKSTSVKSRLKCWKEHYLFVMRWAKENNNNNYDIILCTSNPPINALIGLRLKKLFKAKFIYVYWDLYPQVIETLMTGLISGIISHIWNVWNARNLVYIDQIVTIGEVLKESIQSRIKRRLNIKVVPFPVNTNFIRPINKLRNPFVIDNNLTDYFIVLYSGKIGKGHNIELILDAAEKMKTEKKILFVFIGDGEKKVLVEEYINKGYRNVKLFPLQPWNKMCFSIACGDIGIVSQEQKSSQYFLPSKVFSMMSAGEAIVGICSNHDDLQRVIDENEIGISVKKNDVDMLCDAIRKLYEDEILLNQCKIKAREIAEKKYSNEVVSEMYKELFEDF